jgi:hypothetical protein
MYGRQHQNFFPTWMNSSSNNLARIYYSHQILSTQDAPQAMNRWPARFPAKTQLTWPSFEATKQSARRAAPTGLKLPAMGVGSLWWCSIGQHIDWAKPSPLQ